MHGSGCVTYWNRKIGKWDSNIIRKLLSQKDSDVITIIIITITTTTITITITTTIYCRCVLEKKEVRNITAVLYRYSFLLSDVHKDTHVCVYCTCVLYTKIVQQTVYVYFCYTVFIIKSKCFSETLIYDFILYTSVSNYPPCIQQFSHRPHLAVIKATSGFTTHFMFPPKQSRTGKAYTIHMGR